LHLLREKFEQLSVDHRLFDLAINALS